MVQTGYVPEDSLGLPAQPPVPPAAVPIPPDPQADPARIPPAPPPVNPQAVEQDEAPIPPPPTSIAGVDVIDAEPSAEDDDRPYVIVRGRTFHLRAAVPGLLLMRLAKSQVEVQQAQDDPAAQAAVMAATGDSITKLVVAEERRDFTSFVEEIDPPIEVRELMAMVKEMLEKVAGRPTQSA